MNIYDITQKSPSAQLNEDREQLVEWVPIVVAAAGVAGGAYSAYEMYQAYDKYSSSDKTDADWNELVRSLGTEAAFAATSLLTGGVTIPILRHVMRGVKNGGVDAVRKTWNAVVPKSVQLSTGTAAERAAERLQKAALDARKKLDDLKTQSTTKPVSSIEKDAAEFMRKKTGTPPKPPVSKPTPNELKQAEKGLKKAEKGLTKAEKRLSNDTLSLTNFGKDALLSKIGTAGVMTGVTSALNKNGKPITNKILDRDTDPNTPDPTDPIKYDKYIDPPSKDGDDTRNTGVKNWDKIE